MVGKYDLKFPDDFSIPVDLRIERQTKRLISSEIIKKNEIQEFWNKVFNDLKKKMPKLKCFLGLLKFFMEEGRT